MISVGAQRLKSDDFLKVSDFLNIVLPTFKVAQITALLNIN